MSPRKRSKLSRYDPKLMQELRDLIAKAPNPMFGQMLKADRTSDADLMDFALNVSCSYFSGELLKAVKAAAERALELLQRNTVLVVAANFDATATFTAEGQPTFTRLTDADADTRADAIQKLVDTGVPVKEAMYLLATPPPQQGQSWHMRAPLPVHDLREPVTQH